MRRIPALLAVAAAIGVAAPAVRAQQGDTQAEIERYREMLQDGNPAELTVARGEDMWKQKRGPRQASLERCDLGKGPGVVKGAYAELPRYFADTDSVMDLEARLVHCQATLQGFDRAELVKKPFSGTAQRATDNEALVAYVVDQSRGMTVNVPQRHPKEIEAYQRGQKIFFFRGGPYDFSCASCHGEDDKRIRLQDLPNLLKKQPAQRAFTTWPAYRVSQGALRTMQWRLNDCFRQQRFPELEFISPASIDLITFLGVNAQGGKMNSPAIKR
ncbi:MAG: sulfur oxidation c-type cytochrome SoxA [Burkholderiales bacterium]|nr:sulfur oxidation c-type cytochrome SoxA [Burkholderiales bacterium]OJX05231.1 MAG: sulfur oxidation c-type cytochrome SoxA [Burkholderiales bacterium 70-64]